MTSVVHGLPLKAFERVGPADLAVLEAGRVGAPVVVLLHGFPTHSVLWRKVVRRLGDDVHALAPDLLGLGDTRVSPYEDLGAPMQAQLLVDWLVGRGVDRVVLVGHEQGGAVAQQVVATRPELVAGLVLVASVAGDGWPTPAVAQVMRLARAPGVDVLAYALDLPRRVAGSALVGFGRAVHDPASLDRDVVEEYLRPLLGVEGRERARRFLLAGDARTTVECRPGAPGLRGAGPGGVGGRRRLRVAVVGAAPGRRPGRRRRAHAGAVLRAPGAGGGPRRRRRGDPRRPGPGRGVGRWLSGHATHYDVLGVPTGADAAEIRRAYLVLARRFHPDAHSDRSPAERAHAERRMSDVNEAWADLSDARRREAYDARFLRPEARPGAPGPARGPRLAPPGR